MKTLIINGHPDKDSYCSKLAYTYYQAKNSLNGEAQIINISDLKFNVNLIGGYKNNTLEADLLEAQKKIGSSDHIVFVYPTWWWTMPAQLKGFIDRIFTPGFAFAYEKNNPIASKLLKGKTATLIVTMDSPHWYYKWLMKDAGHFVMKKGILDFCGIKTSKIITIDNHRNLTEEKRKKWMDKIQALAEK